MMTNIIHKMLLNNHDIYSLYYVCPRCSEGLHAPVFPTRSPRTSPALALNPHERTNVNWQFIPFW